MGTNPMSADSTGSGGKSKPREPRRLSGRTSRRANSKSASASAKARAKILIEWLGGVDPPNPSRNIHQPGEYLDQLLKSIGVAEGIDEQRLKEVWGAVAGQFVAQHTIPESIRNSVLVLRVLQPTMKFHLQQMSGKLLENLHRELGKETVKQVVFKIG